MSNDLVAPGDLEGFAGAPFSEVVVDAAVAELRKVAGWHIAPSRTETVYINSDGSVILPTLQLTQVIAASDVSSVDGDPTVLTGWRSNPTLRFRAGILGRPCGWPCGELEFQIVHGYEQCPSELLPAIAAACRQINADSRSIQSQSSGPFSVTFRDSTGEIDPAVSRYSLPSRP